MGKGFRIVHMSDMNELMLMFPFKWRRNGYKGSRVSD